MGKKYSVRGHGKVIVTTIFEDDGIMDLKQQALDAIEEAAYITENFGVDEEVYTDDWEIENGSLEEIQPQQKGGEQNNENQ